MTERPAGPGPAAGCARPRGWAGASAVLAGGSAARGGVGQARRLGLGCGCAPFCRPGPGRLLSPGFRKHCQQARGSMAARSQQRPTRPGAAGGGRCGVQPGRAPAVGAPAAVPAVRLGEPAGEGPRGGPGGCGHGPGRGGPLAEPLSGSQIRVGLKQAEDLRARGPGGTADPYACVSLSSQAGHTHETRVHRGTLRPVFDETCCFHVSPGPAGGGPGPGTGARLTAPPAGATGGAARDHPEGSAAGFQALLPARAAGRAAPAAGHRGPAARPGALAPAGPPGHRRGEALTLRRAAAGPAPCRQGR